MIIVLLASVICAASAAGHHTWFWMFVFLALVALSATELIWERNHK